MNGPFFFMIDILLLLLVFSMYLTVRYNTYIEQKSINESHKMNMENLPSKESYSSHQCSPVESVESIVNQHNLELRYNQ